MCKNIDMLAVPMRYIACVVLVLAGRPLIFAQSACQNLAPTATIDGSQCPGLIPDAVAFRLFLSAASHAQTPSARLQPMGLIDADATALLQALPGFAGAMQSAAASGSSLDAIASGTMQSLSGTMTPAGFQSLTAYVRSQKQSLAYVPDDQR